MLLDEAIYTHFAAIAEITAFVPAKNIQWASAENEITIPRLVYRLISAPQLPDSNDQWQRWEIITVHQDRWICKEIANLVKKNLNYRRGATEGPLGGVGGMNVDYIELIEDRDPVEREDHKYEVIQEFRFCFH